MVPLSKAGSDIPTRHQMRPIMICSPFQKAQEARFLPILNGYLINKLVPCQTGFIPKMGIQVNLTRAIYIIQEKMRIRRNTYGLFIDFANAYNTVPHQRLFEKLREKGCMEEREIDYLEALYSRYRIRIGNRIIKYNKGLAQGSILSPALFNIFIEDLATSLANEIGLSIQEVLFYADDILVLCQTPQQVRRCIWIIEKWSEENGMKLNKKKSGIVVFAPRKDRNIPFMKPVMKQTGKKEAVVSDKKRDGEKKKRVKRIIRSVGREFVPAQGEFEGIPIVSRYKYLGTYLDSTLSMKKQLEFINDKADFLFVKLYPYLANATAGGRKDMWRAMVCPLFNAILVLLYCDQSESNYRQVEKLWFQTFKEFMMIPKSTSSSLVKEMIGVELDELVYINTQNSARKWYARSYGLAPVMLNRTRPIDYLKGIPNEFCIILKQQCSHCKICKNSNRNACHMETYHNIEIAPYWIIWRAIKDNYEYEVKRQMKKNPTRHVKREVFLKYWRPILQSIAESTEKEFAKIRC
jgi:hypothetical protein